MLHVTYMSQVLGCTSYVIYCMFEMHCILFWVHPNVSHMSTCHLLDVTCHMWHVTSYMLHITCLMLHVICHKCLAFCSEFIQIYPHLTCQPVTCYMSHVTCHMLHVTCHMSHVACHISYITCPWKCHACMHAFMNAFILCHITTYHMWHVTRHMWHVTCHL